MVKEATLGEIVELTAPKWFPLPLPKQIYSLVVNPGEEVHNIIRDEIDAGTGYGRYFDANMTRQYIRQPNCTAVYIVLSYDDETSIAFCELESCEVPIAGLLK